MSDTKQYTCYDWIQEFDEKQLLFSFKGDFNQDLVNAILFLSEEKHAIHENGTMIKNRIFGIMVECMQNICKHGASLDNHKELRPGIVLIGKQKDAFILTVGNFIYNQDVPRLDDQLKLIVQKEKDDLRELQIRSLQQNKLSEKSGGGLGIISIARKSETIEHHFKRVNDEISFFSLKVTISTRAGDKK